MHRATFAASTLIALLVACSSDRASAPTINETASADVAAAELDALAASAEQAGDELAGAPYRDAAEAVRLGDRVSVITLEIDGRRSRFFAVSYLVTLAPTSGCGTSGLVIGVPGSIDCVRLLSRPALVAWERANARRILIVHGPLGPINFGSRAIAARGSPGSALLIDNRSGVWWATSGVAESRVISTLGECPSPPRLPPGASADCERTEFRWELDADFEPAPLLRPTPAATGTAHVRMGRQSVFGILLDVTNLPAAPLPPFALLEPSLQLTVAQDAVTIRFGVTNRSSATQSLLFSDGQRYDFIVRDALGGRVLWRWSDGKVFTQALGQEQLAPAESRRYTEVWRPGAVRGRVLVEARLTSSSHPLRVIAPLDLP